MLTKEQQLVQTLANLNEDHEYRIVSVTPKEPNKKSRISKVPTPPSLLKTKKYAVRDNMLIGVDYTKLIKQFRFAEASLIEKAKKFFFGDSFKAQQTYTVPIVPNGSIVQHKEKGTNYVRTYSRSDAPVHSEYYDGNNHIITQSWKQLEAEYFKLASKNKSQGLENPVRVNNFKMKHVKYVEDMFTGEVLYNDLSKRILRRLKLLK